MRQEDVGQQERRLGGTERQIVGDPGQFDEAALDRRGIDQAREVEGGGQGQERELRLGQAAAGRDAERIGAARHVGVLVERDAVLVRPAPEADRRAVGGEHQIVAEPLELGRSLGESASGG